MENYISNRKYWKRAVLINWGEWAGGDGIGSDVDPENP